MTKHDWIWVAIRIFGIYLLVLAIIAIPSLISSMVGFYQTYLIGHADDWEKIQQTVRITMVREFINSLFRLLFLAPLEFISSGAVLGCFGFYVRLI